MEAGDAGRHAAEPVEEVRPDVNEGVEEVSAATALARVEELKTLGGNEFKQGQVEAALRCYDEGVSILDSFTCGVDSALRAALCANQALCLLKLERFAEAEQRAGAALAADPANSKATYRRGLARLHLKDAAGACEDFARGLRLEPQNREVRLRYEEAKQLADAVQLDNREVAAAANATAALGAADGGLYAEKPDLNEGRLAETHQEQREWIKTISMWKDITDISFADEDSKISVYMSLPGLGDIPPNKVCVWFQANSLEVRVIDLKGDNWCYVAQELWGQIDPAGSSWKIRRDKLSLKLQKRASARSWDRWEKLRRI